MAWSDNCYSDSAHGDRAVEMMNQIEADKDGVVEARWRSKTIEQLVQHAP